MNEELQNMIVKTQHPDALGRLLRYAADRLDQIRAELFPKHKAAATEKEGSDGR